MEAHNVIPSLDQCWTPATDGHLYEAEKTPTLKHRARELTEDSREVRGTGDQKEFTELNGEGISN